MASSPVKINAPIRVVDAPDLLIEEYFGNVASGDPRLSACVCTVSAPCEEAFQAPDFDEYVLVLEGVIEIVRDGLPTTKVTAGNALFLAKGTRVKWVWPGPCKYVPICLPAFNPENCNRDGESKCAKSDEDMQRLRELHASSKHPFLFHAAQKKRWEACKASGKTYYPPTYEQDGFLHATADPAALVDVLNHFYTEVEGDWVCLRMTQNTLQTAGISTTFESTAPVGDTAAFDAGDELFPHVQGGLPPSGVVFEELPIVRTSGGKFVNIPGIFSGNVDTTAAAAPSRSQFGYGMATGLVIGAVAGIAYIHHQK